MTPISGPPPTIYFKRQDSLEFTKLPPRSPQLCGHRPELPDLASAKLLDEEPGVSAYYQLMSVDDFPGFEYLPGPALQLSVTALQDNPR